MRGEGGIVRDDHGVLALENQLCFRLYSASKEIVRRYKPYLDPLGITYTQYLVMMALWAQESMSVKELGARLGLDSSTLTPVLKKLQADGYITRERSKADERVMIATLTEEGRELHDRAIDVPRSMALDLGVDPKLAVELAALLDEFLRQVR